MLQIASFLKVFSINLIIILLGLSFIEAFLQTQPQYYSFAEMASGNIYIDNVDSLSYGSFIVNENDTLPYRTRPNYKHSILVKNSSYPIPWILTTDKYGYRNPEIEGSTELLIVGDSVTMGPGVNDDENFVSIIGAHLQKPVYNLSIGGAGYAIYMGMLNEYLQTRQAPKKLFIISYIGNDFSDNNKSYWPELKQGQVPKNKVFRKGSFSFSSEPPPFLMTTPLRHIKLVTLLYLFTQNPKPSEITHLNHRLGSDAVSALKNLNWHVNDDTYLSNKQSGLDIINKLLALGDLPSGTDGDLKLLYEYIQHNNITKIPELTQNIVLKFINMEYYPLGSNYMNLTTHLSAKVGRYYYNIINANSKATLALVKYKNFLKQFTSDEKLKTLTFRIQFELSKNGNIDIIRLQKDVKKLSLALSNKFGDVYPNWNTDVYSKENIFIDFLDDIRAKYGTEITFFFLPGENVSSASDQWYLISKFNKMKASLKERNIPTFDLTNKFKSYYIKSPSSLHLDMHHLNKKGHYKVAEWILDVGMAEQ